MSETLDTRRRKRIVEHVVSGFNSGQHAADFGRAVNKMVTKKVGKQKFQTSIAAPNTKMAITERWVGPTILKTIFLDLKDQQVAIFITEGMRRTIRENNLKLEQEIVREKPQPQSISVRSIPISTKIQRIG